jgi:hypothetical protein
MSCRWPLRMPNSNTWGAEMFLVGQRVQITPKGREAREFWSFVDGWIGTVQGLNNGNVEVLSQGKTFFVQPENLTAIK